MPMQRRLPKRGFTPLNRTEYQVVNLYQLEALTEAEITPDLLADRGLIGHANRPVKVLGSGDLTRTIQIRAHRFSRSAREKIEAQGGQAEEIAGS